MEIRDLNGDGKPHIATLFAQATERMSFFFNRGDGEFESWIIFQKHPAFGHTYFEMADFDGEGKPDLLVTNGDNDDHESPPKPYHGLLIYLHRGGEKFEEKVFMPLHGAYKAVARDFDGDDDLDIAAISYYPDYRNAPRESFVLLENLGKFQFTASTFPNCTDGRRLTMDAGDLDGDGDVDIVLGAVRKGFGPTYREKDNSNKKPLRIHRAPLETQERLIGFLIESRESGRAISRTGSRRIRCAASRSTTTKR